MWNSADIYLEIKDSAKAMGDKDFLKFGEVVGKIVSDVVVKNPTDFSWNLNNSDVF